MPRTDDTSERLGKSQWYSNLPTREQDEVRFAELYAKDFDHGTPGALSYTVIAKLAAQCDQLEMMHGQLLDQTAIVQVPFMKGWQIPNGSIFIYPCGHEDPAPNNIWPTCPTCDAGCNTGPIRWRTPSGTDVSIPAGDPPAAPAAPGTWVRTYACGHTATFSTFKGMPKACGECGNDAPSWDSPLVHPATSA